VQKGTRNRKGVRILARARLVFYCAHNLLRFLCAQGKEALEIAQAVSAIEGFYPGSGAIEKAVAKAYNCTTWEDARKTAQGGNAEIQALKSQVSSKAISRNHAFG
jgi:hypothetical protein